MSKMNNYMRTRANKELKAIVISRAGELGFNAPEMIEEINRELSIISFTGAASCYLMIHKALTAANAQSEEYWLGGSLTSAFIPFLMGLSDINPFDSIPRVYPEFCYGLGGDLKHPGFDLRVSEELYIKLQKNYFTHEKWDMDSSAHFLMEGCNQGELRVYTVNGRMGDEHITIRINIIPVTKNEASLNAVIGKEILDICKPRSIEDYVKCFGLSKGTGIWEDNAKVLLTDGDADIKGIIANREDVYEVLLNAGMSKLKAYHITEDVRKGIINRRGWDDKTREDFKRIELPEWFLDCCEKVEYLWPRSHAMSYAQFNGLDDNCV